MLTIILILLFRNAFSIPLASNNEIRKSRSHSNAISNQNDSWSESKNELGLTPGRTIRQTAWSKEVKDDTEARNSQKNDADLDYNSKISKLVSLVLDFVYKIGKFENVNLENNINAKNITTTKSKKTYHPSSIQNDSKQNADMQTNENDTYSKTYLQLLEEKLKEYEDLKEENLSSTDFNTSDSYEDSDFDNSEYQSKSEAADSNYQSSFKKDVNKHEHSEASKDLISSQTSSTESIQEKDLGLNHNIKECSTRIRDVERSSKNKHKLRVDEHYIHCNENKSKENKLSFASEKTNTQAPNFFESREEKITTQNRNTNDEIVEKNKMMSNSLSSKQNDKTTSKTMDFQISTSLPITSFPSSIKQSTRKNYSTIGFEEINKPTNGKSEKPPDTNYNSINYLNNTKYTNSQENVSFSENTETTNSVKGTTKGKDTILHDYFVANLEPLDETTQSPGKHFESKSVTPTSYNEQLTSKTNKYKITKPLKKCKHTKNINQESSTMETINSNIEKSTTENIILPDIMETYNEPLTSKTNKDKITKPLKKCKHTNNINQEDTTMETINSNTEKSTTENSISPDIESEKNQQNYITTNSPNDLQDKNSVTNSLHKQVTSNVHSSLTAVYYKTNNNPINAMSKENESETFVTQEFKYIYIDEENFTTLPSSMKTNWNKGTRTSLSDSNSKVGENHEYEHSIATSKPLHDTNDFNAENESDILNNNKLVERTINQETLATLSISTNMNWDSARIITTPMTNFLTANDLEDNESSEIDHEIPDISDKRQQSFMSGNQDNSTALSSDDNFADEKIIRYGFSDKYKNLEQTNNSQERKQFLTPKQKSSDVDKYFVGEIANNTLYNTSLSNKIISDTDDTEKIDTVGTSLEDSDFEYSTADKLMSISRVQNGTLPINLNSTRAEEQTYFEFSDDFYDNPDTANTSDNTWKDLERMSQFYSRQEPSHINYDAGIKTDTGKVYPNDFVEYGLIQDFQRNNNYKKYENPIMSNGDSPQLNNNQELTNNNQESKESYNTILEYLYKHSNSPFIQSLKKEINH